MELILPQFPEVIVSLISFLVLFGVLAKFAFPAINKMLDDRAAKIKESLERAEETRVEAERLLEDYKTQMAEARQEASRVIEQGRKVAETMKAEIVAQANVEREGLLARAREEIEGEKKAAMAELQASVADLSVGVAGRILGTTMSKADHAALIDKYLAEVGSINE
jgi:F-type H+-transporting ATPase subunit b